MKQLPEVVFDESTPIRERIKAAEEAGATSDKFKKFKESVDKKMNFPVQWPPSIFTLVKWKHKGVTCAVTRQEKPDVVGNKEKRYYGYVHVEEGHPLERSYYDEFDPRLKYNLSFRCKSEMNGSWFGFVAQPSHEMARNFLGQLPILEAHEQTEKLAEYFLQQFIN